MSNKCRIGVIFLLMAFMAFIYAPIASAQDIFIDSNTCAGVGQVVVFTISVPNAPNEVKSFGFEISYDGSVLQYDSFEKGTLVASFPICDVNPIDANTLKMGGLDFMTGIPAGASGTIAKLHFTVTQCGPSTINLNNLADDIDAWSVQAGELKTVPVVTPKRPVLEAIENQTLTAGETLTFTVTLKDYEAGDTISYSATGLPVGATLDAVTGDFSWVPTEAQGGQTYPVMITATDDTNGLSDSESINITVNKPVQPHAPVLATINNQTVTAGETLTFSVTATDEDLDTISYSATDLPVGASLASVTGEFAWTSTSDEVGQSYSVTITATDSTGLSDSKSVTIKVVSAVLTINDQVCVGVADEEVTFTVSLNSAPKEIDSFGFNVKYDGSVLEYKPPASDADLRGDLTKGFAIFNASNPDPNTVIVAGIAPSNPIAQGSSGQIVNLTFVVKSCESSQIRLDVLDDDVTGWSTQAGRLNVAPYLVCPGYTEIEADGAAGATVAGNAALEAFLNGATATDAFNNLLVVTNDAPAVLPLGSTEVTFSATNAEGISNSCTASVSVVDTTAPDITCPANITVEAEKPGGVDVSNAAIQAFLNGVTATDAVDGAVSVTNDAPPLLNIGNTVVTFSATDSAGNTNSCTASVSVVDTTAPDITCPANITVEAEGPNGVAASNSAIQKFLNGAIAIDAVDGAVSVTNDAPVVFGLGNTVVTFSVIDSAGNTNNCTATVSVVDTTDPVITCPDPSLMTLEAEGPSGVPASRAAIQTFLNSVTATDAVDDGLVSVTNDAPAVFGLGNTEVTFIVTDRAGNTDRCTGTVSVVDTTDPVITCPGSLTVEAEGPDGVAASNAAIQAFLNGAMATDTVDGLLSVTNDAPAVFGLGNTKVTFSVIDSSNNTNSCTATVTVVDETGPVVTCPGSLTVEAEGPDGVAASNAAIQAFLNGATATDAVDGAVGVDNDAPAVFGLGNTEVTFAATDHSLNLNSCTSSVTVVDTTKPTVNAGDDQEVNEGTEVTLQAEASDICDTDPNSLTYTWTEDGNILSEESSFKGSFEVGEHVLVLTVNDQSGNEGMDSVTITVNETTPSYPSFPASSFNYWGTYPAYSPVIGMASFYPTLTYQPSVNYFSTYQPSVDLYQQFNNQLLNFQQTWTQQPLWNYQQPLWNYQQPVWNYQGSWPYGG